MRKVLFVLPSRYPNGPAGAKLIQRHALGLRHAGMECEILCLNGAQDTATHCEDEFGLKYRNACLGDFKTRNQSPLSVKIARLVEEAVSNRDIGYVWCYDASWKLHRHAIRACNELRVPVVVHLTEWLSLRWHLLRGFLDQQLFVSFCMSRVNGLISISTPWAVWGQRRGIPSIRTPGPCPPRCFMADAQKALALPLGQCRFLYVGQLYRRDMPEIMLLGIREVVKKWDHVHFDIVGSTLVRLEGRRFCKAVVKDPLLNKRVKIHGFLEEPDFGRVCASTTAYLLLHDDSWESRACFPTRLSEFIASGKPVIVSGVGDIPLYLQHKVHAFVLSPDKTVSGLVAAVAAIIENPLEGRKMGARALKLAETSFSVETVGLLIARFLATIHV